MERVAYSVQFRTSMPTFRRFFPLVGLLAVAMSLLVTPVFLNTSMPPVGNMAEYGRLMANEVLVGLMLGLAAAASFGNLAAKLLFGVQPRDTMTFASATLILVLVAIAAGYIPARRATRVEPATALRNG